MYLLVIFRTCCWKKNNQTFGKTQFGKTSAGSIVFFWSHMAAKQQFPVYTQNPWNDLLTFHSMKPGELQQQFLNKICWMVCEGCRSTRSSWRRKMLSNWTSAKHFESHWNRCNSKLFNTKLHLAKSWLVFQGCCWVQNFESWVLFMDVVV